MELPDSTVSLSSEDFRFICEIVFRESAIILENEKDYLVDSRLAPLAKSEGFPSIIDLVKTLRRSPHPLLVKKVVNVMTTNATSFYRDIHPFRALQSHILPRLIEARQDTMALNIWSAGCSSGQEPYSIAIMLKDSFPQLDSWNNYILATDISSEMVERAKKGSYRPMEVNRGLAASQLLKNFSQTAGEWVIHEDLRNAVDFREMNLAAPWPPIPQMDVILLRNVLIYFNSDTKKTILDRAIKVLRPDGFLILGASETTFGLNDAFEQIPIDKALVYQKRA